MENQFFNIPKEELQQFEELLKQDEVSKDEKMSKVQLIILYKLNQWEKRHKEFEKRWMTPYINGESK
jgi:hypothetical protein